MSKNNVDLYGALKPKEQRVIDAYLAEEGAGSGHLKRVAARTGLTYGWIRKIMMRPEILAAVAERRGEITEQIQWYVQAAVDLSQPIIDLAGRKQRLSVIIDDEDEPTSVRLRALELLGKMEGDFVERIQHEGDENRPVVNRIELEERIRRKRNRYEEDPLG